MGSEMAWQQDSPEEMPHSQRSPWTCTSSTRTFDYRDTTHNIRTCHVFLVFDDGIGEHHEDDAAHSVTNHVSQSQKEPQKKKKENTGRKEQENPSSWPEESQAWTEGENILN